MRILLRRSGALRGGTVAWAHDGSPIDAITAEPGTTAEIRLLGADGTPVFTCEGSSVPAQPIEGVWCIEAGDHAERVIVE